MKFIIILLCSFVSACTVTAAPADTGAIDGGDAEGKVVFSNCPDFKLVYSGFQEKIHLDHILGPWDMIRHNCPDPSKADEVDCLRELYYIDDKTPANSINWVFHVRNQTVHKMTSGLLAFKGLEGDKIDNFFEFDFTEPETNTAVKGQSVLIDTDDGSTWSLWATCMLSEPSTKFIEWGILSRSPFIDARLEQTLVERIEKYGKVTAKELRGIGQTDCYKHAHDH